MSDLNLTLYTDDMKECWNSKYEHIQDTSNYYYFCKEWLYLSDTGHYFLQNIEGKVQLLSEFDAKKWIAEQEKEEATT